MVDLVALRMFFMWCTIINAGLLLLGTVVMMVAGDFVYRLHGNWFSFSRETFNGIIYGFLGLLKLLIIVLNLVPYIALLIIGA